MFEIQGPGETQGGHRVTFTREKSPDSDYTYVRKTVHIGLNEQKWLPKEVDMNRYSSLKNIKKLYPNAERVDKEKNKDGSVTYLIQDKGFIDYSTTITLKEDVKGVHMSIVEDRYPFVVSGEYLDGKLIKADKREMVNDPNAVP